MARVRPLLVAGAACIAVGLALSGCSAAPLTPGATAAAVTAPESSPPIRPPAPVRIVAALPAGYGWLAWTAVSRGADSLRLAASNAGCVGPQVAVVQRRGTEVAIGVAGADPGPAAKCAAMRITIVTTVPDVPRGAAVTHLGP